MRWTRRIIIVVTLWVGLLVVGVAGRAYLASTAAIWIARIGWPVLR